MHTDGLKWSVQLFSTYRKWSLPSYCKFPQHRYTVIISKTQVTNYKKWQNIIHDHGYTIDSGRYYEPDLTMKPISRCFYCIALIRLIKRQCFERCSTSHIHCCCCFVSCLSSSVLINFRTEPRQSSKQQQQSMWEVCLPFRISRRAWTI